MADTRYTLLRDLARSELDLTVNDISDTLALILFREALKVYSRFRGIRKITTVEYEDGIADYTIIATIAHIIDIYWNATYPTSVFSETYSDAISEERYHNPSLEVVEALKKRLREKYSDVPFQEWQDYYSGDDHKIRLDPTPTTDIIIEYRELFTDSTYPENDSEAIKTLFKAKMLEHIIGIAQLRSEGDAQFNIEGMERVKSKLESNFYNTVRTVRIVHS